MPITAKTDKKNHGMSLELPYQCSKDPNLKFYTSLVCDAKREGDPTKKVDKLASRRCDRCVGPVLI